MNLGKMLSESLRFFIHKMESNDPYLTWAVIKIRDCKLPRRPACLKLEPKVGPSSVTIGDK